jgi:hypothetical protein
MGPPPLSSSAPPSLSPSIVESASFRRTSSPRWRSPSPRPKSSCRSPRSRHRSPTRRTHATRQRSQSPRRKSPQHRQRSPPRYRRSPSRQRFSPNQRYRSYPEASQTPRRSAVIASAARRDTAIAFIQSSFPSSRTNTMFAGPAVQIDHTRPVPIPGLLQQKGQLTVPANTELRMRYWHLFDPNLSVSDLLTRSLIKGLPYSVTLPPAFSPNLSLPTLQQSLAHIPQGRNEPVSRLMVDQYLNNVRMVLSRPHAYKLLERGGLIWRIVRHYGPQVYARAFIGPLPAADNSTGHNNVINPDEIQALLGVTTNSNSFWPYPEWYEKSGRYNGEWTAANEAWFIKHAEDIRFARQGSLRGGRSWQHTIRIHTAEMVSDPAVSGTMAHAQACCTHLAGKWPELWDRFDISRLTQ